VVGEVTYDEGNGVVGEVTYVEGTCVVEGRERPLVPLGRFDVMLLLASDVQVESIVDSMVSHWICVKFIRRKTRRRRI
jgi:hypothetical protein